MLDVVIALLPAVICTFVFYGWREMMVMGVSVASCVLLEWAITKYMLKKPSTIGDLSAVITGILLALNLPYTTPWWVVVIGAVIAIGVAKMSFGGLGQNIWNPALVGRVFLLVSFPTYMTTWSAPKGLFGLDAVSGATPLGAVQEGLLQGSTIQEIMSAGDYSYNKMLFANLGGSAGEFCVLALLAGFVYLCIRKVVKPWITLSIFGTVALTSLIFWGIDPTRFTDPLFNLLSGGLVLGACFMATDYVTSPMSVKGGIIFGVGIGFLTMMIRYFGSYPEGMSFAILIMNSVVPLLNMWFKQKKFGRN
jgi:electron transport complex protein RnfD